MNDLETPAASAEYERAVRHDLAEIEQRIRGVVASLDGLDDGLRLIPRTRSSCAGWKKHLHEIAEQVRTELDDVSEAVTGSRNAITESVDAEAVANVRALRTGT